jgi:hypothetical protein
LNRLAAEEHSDWWKNDRQQVSHCLTRLYRFTVNRHPNPIGIFFVGLNGRIILIDLRIIRDETVTCKAR